MADPTVQPQWTLENAPEPTYDWVRQRLILNRGWYVEIGCSDADEMMLSGLENTCCDSMIFGPFQTRDVADEAGMDLTVDVGPWYYTLKEVKR